MKDVKKKHAVLVVASETEEIGSIVRTLEESDYDFITARSVPEALSNITYRLPNVIISEAEMPEIDGFAFLEKIRKGIKTRLIPFVFITKSKGVKERVHAYQTGADAILVKPVVAEELKAIVASRIRMIEEFYHIAVTDELTRLYNRREFLKKFNEEIYREEKRRISLALMDLDHFKQINDIHGHQMGDNVLMTFAEVIMSVCQDVYFPARFGGEEFVVLFPGLGSVEAKEIVDRIRNVFGAISFQGDKKKVFYVNFSAGVAEYPLMAANLSHLLSKADHALYAAKNEGRGKTLVYSPLMARNDRFWEHLKGSREIFLTKEHADVVSGLLYLPRALEMITNLDFEIQSIGTMAISIRENPTIAAVRGRQNLHYDVRNIVSVIVQACENNFASETFYCRGSFFECDFVVLFPSIADFSFNLQKFRELCDDIFQSISKNPACALFDLGYACDVMYFNRKKPWELLDGVKRIIGEIRSTDEKMKKYEKLRRKARTAFQKTGQGKQNIETKYFFNTFNLHREYQYFAVSDGPEYVLELDILLENGIKKHTESFMKTIAMHSRGGKSLPIMVSWNGDTDLQKFIDVLGAELKGKRILLMINEAQITDTVLETLGRTIRGLPSSISFGLDNCFIGPDLLNVLSSVECRALCFSENVIRNIHTFKERIKIINGAKIFADQLGIPVMAKNVMNEEEYLIVRDLGIYYASGPYMEQILKQGIIHPHA